MNQPILQQVKQMILFIYSNLKYSHLFSFNFFKKQGVRSVSLIELFISKGYEIHFFSPSKPNASTKKLEENYKIHTYHTLANDPLFDKCIDPLDPEIGFLFISSISSVTLF